MKQLLTFTCLCLFSLLASGASAQKYDRSFRDWSVYTHSGSCYMASAPVRQTGNYSRRGQPYILVAHRDVNHDEVNISSGYPYKPKKDVIASIEGHDYKMFSKGETAWAYDAKSDNAIVTAMKNGTDMRIKGTSAKGTWSEDKYSLMGFSAAYKHMKSLCR